MAHRELVAVQAAPVVEQQDHAFARTRFSYDAMDRCYDLLERIRPPGVGQVEPGQREAHAAIPVLERGDLSVPQPVRVGPTVDHHDRLGALTFDDHLDAIDLHPPQVYV